MVGHRARKSSVSEVASALLSPIANLLHLDSPRSPKASTSAALLKEEPFEDDDGERKRVELRVGGMTVSFTVAEREALLS
jgi:hypothetical protein